jgi:hypothetical protein
MDGMRKEWCCWVSGEVVERMFEIGEGSVRVG